MSQFLCRFFAFFSVFCVFFIAILQGFWNIVNFSTFLNLADLDLTQRLRLTYLFITWDWHMIRPWFFINFRHFLQFFHEISSFLAWFLRFLTVLRFTLLINTVWSDRFWQQNSAIFRFSKLAKSEILWSGLSQVLTGFKL